MSNKAELTVEGRKLPVSNLNKVLWPKTGFTKGQMIDYYIRIAPALLRQIQGRPLTLKRYPNGVEGEYFYEKQCPSHRPPWVQVAPVWSGHNVRTINFCLVEDLPTLVWVANLASLELHTSLSASTNVGQPTAVVFDLDPGAPATILDCCRVALDLRSELDAAGLNAFPKTSGSVGLHVYVPLNTAVTFDAMKAFAKRIARELARRDRDRVVDVQARSKRAGKVLVDWLQNDANRSTVAPYSLRAMAWPTVSTPVTWEEVERALAAGDPDVVTFGPEDVLARLERDGDLFAPVLEVRQALEAD